MVLASPVNSPEQPDIDLLKQGFILDEKVIARLPDYGIAFVYVDYPGLDDLDRHLAPNLSPARQKMYQQMKQTIGAAQRRTNAGIPYMDYYQTSRELVLTLLSQGQHPVFMDHLSRLGTDAVGHATAVAHLSLLLGIKLERYLIAERTRLPASHAKEVVNLGVAGMLHDMGKMRLPEDVRHFTEAEPPEDPEQLKVWQSHSRESYEMIHDGLEPTASVAILHHHQHFDGTGFPPQRHKDGTVTTFAEKKIHVFSRIVHAANLYDRLATPLKGPKRTNLEVLHLMRTRHAGWVDPAVLQAVHLLCPPFPPGIAVTLSDGTRGVVVQIDPTNVYRPVIRRYVDDGMTLATESIHLKDQPELSVASISGVSVEGMLPEPAGAAVAA
jgi:HD-GYP domain-containing protein (c-di-GMP phosphodiesterase class II)